MCFLTDVTNKTMACYTFSVRQTIPESENSKFALKNLMKKKMKNFARKSISTLKSLVSAKKKHFEKFFAVDGVSFTEQ